MVYRKIGDTLSAEDMRRKLEKELENAQGQIKRLQKLLASDFAKKAPAHVVQNEKEKLETFRQTANKIEEQLSSL